MKKTVEKIQNVTSRGQVTLPVEWRRRFNTNQVVVTTLEDKIEISPAQVRSTSEYTVFDAIRDNKGKGIKAKDLSKILKKIDK